jgi:hypothetical protein
MSFNSTQSRAVIGLLTSHNTLRQHLYLLGLQDSRLCRKCGVMEETSAQILCECEAVSSLRHAYLGSFYLEPKDIQSISLGAIWSFSKASGLPWLDMGHKGLALRPRRIGAVRSQTLDILTHWQRLGHMVAQVVQALCYKPEGCEFDSQWCQWNFSLT